MKREDEKKMLICKICGLSAKNSLQAHINHSHHLRNKEYLQQYPNSQIYSERVSDRLKYTNAHRDPSYKIKLSESSKRLRLNPEWVAKHDASLKKAQNTLEAKEHHRLGMLHHMTNRTPDQAKYRRQTVEESWKDPVKRQNRVQALQKAHKDPEVRKHHSEAAREKFRNMTAEQRIAFRQNLKDTWARPELRKKILELSKIGLEKANTPESRQKIKETNKTPETKARRHKVAMDRLAKQPIISSLNIKFGKALSANALYPKAEQPVGPYTVDFLFPDVKLIVEVDGDFWHANPSLYKTIIPMQKRTVDKDKREVTFCKNHGWTLLRFWETDINKDISSCIQKVQEKLYELQN